MQRLVITGAAGLLGRRVLAQLRAASGDPAGARWQVVGLDLEPLPAGAEAPSGYQHLQLDVTDADCKGHLHGAAVVVHLAGVPEGRTRDGVTSSGGAAAVNAAITRAVLDAASSAGVAQVVLVSSATVYGAWPDNPVPIAEDLPLRPNPGFAYAQEKAEIERLAREWSEAHPAATCTVLRPAPVLGAPGMRTWLADVTKPALGDRIGMNAANRQYVHIDDVAGAILHVALHRLDGTFNVAPDRWIAGDDVPALLGPDLKLPLPDPVSAVVSRLAERRVAARQARTGDRPPDIRGAAPYARFSWVVANDRLKATGWRPLSSSEEAFVGSVRPSSAQRFVARHRQEVTLAAVVALLAAAVGAVLLGVRWRRRRMPGRVLGRVLG